MQQSLLRVDQIIFRQIEIRATENPNLQANYEINCEVEVFQNKEDMARWRVDLIVRISGNGVPYSGCVSAVGHYTVRSEQAEEATLNLVNVNGPALLYSSIRELVVTLTGRGPHPSFLLPSVTFIDRKLKKEPRNNPVGETTTPLISPEAPKGENV